MSWGFGFRPYVPVHRRIAQAHAYARKIAKQEKRAPEPVEIEGRKIADSFWGMAWLEHLECFSDFANRLPRGRTYVRNGSVADLVIERGKVRAIVGGSEVYRVKIDIQTLTAAAWNRIKSDCARSIDSLIDLLQGRFDEGIMQRLTERDTGLFPKPKEIKMSCTCPDWAGMCKHVAATLYGVGARLDTAPELLFTLRDVDHLKLIGEAVAGDNLDQALQGKAENALEGSDLGEIFGIEIESNVQTKPASKARRPKVKAKPAKPRAAKKRTAPRAVKKPR